MVGPLKLPDLRLPSQPHSVTAVGPYQIILIMPMTYVPETGTRFWYHKTGTRTWHQFLVPVARFMLPETYMADDADKIAAVCVMALIVYYIIMNNLNNLE